MAWQAANRNGYLKQFNGLVGSVIPNCHKIFVLRKEIFHQIGEKKIIVYFKCLTSTC